MSKRSDDPPPTLRYWEKLSRGGLRGVGKEVLHTIGCRHRAPPNLFHKTPRCILRRRRSVTLSSHIGRRLRHRHRGRNVFFGGRRTAILYHALVHLIMPTPRAVRIIRLISVAPPSLIKTFMYGDVVPTNHHPTKQEHFRR